jgi:AMMECR1 domain-containing protein
VRRDELDGLEVELSLLTPLVPARPQEVIPGEHGVVLKLANRMGVFLPQVAAEHGWDLDTLLEQLCRKAGLPRGAWRDGEARLETFRTQVVSESERRV